MNPVVVLRMLRAPASEILNGMSDSRDAEQFAAQHIERDVGGERTNALAIGRPLHPTYFRAIRGCQAEKHQANLSAIRARIAGDRQRVIRSSSGASAFRHGLGHRFTNSAMF